MVPTSEQIIYSHINLYKIVNLQSNLERAARVIGDGANTLEKNNLDPCEMR